MKYILIFIFFICLNGGAQNLVINPSIDDKNVLAFGTLSSESNWNSPNFSSPDHYSISKDFGYGVAPMTRLGYQRPKHGKSFNGIIISYNNVKSTRLRRYREFIQGQLKEKLIRGEKYFVQFFICLSDFSPIAINSVGLGFREKSQEQLFFRGRFPKKQIIQSPKNNFLTDTLNWVEVNGIYIANGEEQFLSIGNFKNFLGTKCRRVERNTSKEKLASFKKLEPIHGSYMFIDDISVIRIPDNYSSTREDNTAFIDTILPNRPDFGKSFILKNCNFIQGKLTFSSKTLISLTGMTKYLMINPFLTFKLDLIIESNLSKGKAEYLQNKRAEMIYKQLGLLGISLNRIYIESTIKKTESEEKNYIEFSFLEDKVESIPLKELR